MGIDAGTYEMGPDHADLLLRTFRAGLIGAVGHDLVLRVNEWSAEVEIGEEPADCSLRAEIDLRTIEVVSASGGIKPLSDGDRAEIAGNAKTSLDVKRTPVATYRSTAVEGDWSGGVISGELHLHGTTAPLALTIDRVDGAYRATATITQTDFGIRPYSAMFGTLTIRDDVGVEVAVEFE